MAKRRHTVRRPPAGRKGPAQSKRSSPNIKSESGNGTLRRELAKARRELTEARQQQNVTADVLKVISRSAFDLQAVFETLVESSVRLCGADRAFIFRFDGELLRMAAGFNCSPEFTEWVRQHPIRPGRHSGAARAALERRTIHIPDVLSDPNYTYGAKNVEAIRTVLGVPILKGDDLLGVMMIYHLEVRPFADRQIALVETFADQAAIAIENVRLFEQVQARTEDLRESLQQQTATADVLKVISRSTFDLQIVLDALVESATKLCEADHTWLFQRDGDLLRFKSSFGHRTEVHARLRDLFLSREAHINRGSVVGRSTLEARVVHVADVLADPEYTRSDAQKIGGYRAALGAPLLRDGKVVGVIFVAKNKPEPFSEKQIKLVTTFADQAVIAIENLRLFDEIQARTADLQESLEYQTATSDVLEVISRSTSDLQPVLDTMLKAALRLCRLRSGAVAIRQGEVLRYVATIGLTPEFDNILRSRDIVPGDKTLAGQTALQGRVVQIEDLAGDPDYRFPEAVTLNRTRTVMGVPLLREGEIFGVIALTRDYVEPFSERQVSLARTFADQAVIAMENARLLGELTRREHELRATFDHMGDGVVMFDADLKLASWNRNFQELLDISDSFLAGRPDLGDYVRLLVGRGELGDGDVASTVVAYRERVDEVWSTERIRPDGRVIEVRNNPVPGGGAVLIYSDITHRKKAEEEIRAARDAAEAALERQTATAEILKVIAGSPSDEQPVLEAVVKAAVSFCGGEDAVIAMREGDKVLVGAHEGPIPHDVGRRMSLDRTSALGRAVLDARTILIPDLLAPDAADSVIDQNLACEFGIPGRGRRANDAREGGDRRALFT